MSLPTPWLLHVRRWAPGEPDRYGNVIDTWGGIEPWPVHAYWQSTPEERQAAGRDLLTDARTVIAPATADRPTYRDLVVIDGLEFRIEGEPADYTHGPWPMPIAGLVYNVTRAEG